MRELSCAGIVVSFILFFVFGWLGRRRAAGYAAGAMLFFFMLSQGAVYVLGSR
jgi:hypothetical protein